jgi:hypothetical protein
MKDYKMLPAAIITIATVLIIILSLGAMATVLLRK